MATTMMIAGLVLALGALLYTYAQYLRVDRANDALREAVSTHQRAWGQQSDARNLVVQREGAVLTRERMLGPAEVLNVQLEKYRDQYDVMRLQVDTLRAVAIAGQELVDSCPNPEWRGTAAFQALAKAIGPNRWSARVNERARDAERQVAAETEDS